MRLLSNQIHERALEISARYKRTESELIDILQQADEHRVYLELGHASLFSYVTQALGLSESVAYGLITIARMAKEVPELKIQLQSDAMTFSNARRVASVLSPDDSKPGEGLRSSLNGMDIPTNAEWIRKASELSSRELEKEIVRVFPQEAVRERTSYVTVDRMKLELGLSEAEMKDLRRVQDLLSQSEKKSVSLEETIVAMTKFFLTTHDPVEKAKRQHLKEHRTMENREKVGHKKVSHEKADHGKEVLEKEIPKKEIRRKETDLSKKLKLTKAGDVSETKPNGNKSPPELVTLRVGHERIPIPSSVLHAVNLRDQRKCTYIALNGTACDQTRWVEIHHKVPVSLGGKNTLDNLITLCSGHHKSLHRMLEVLR